ncbi:MAG: hypothetical protein ACM3OO_03210, partial [Planctomycetaceae bacterium]
SDRSWVVDQRDGDRWVEFGRHPTEAEAEAAVRRLVSDGRGDASSFRVTTRPVQADEARRVLEFVLHGLVACAVVAVVLVLTWR